MINWIKTRKTPWVRFMSSTLNKPGVLIKTQEDKEYLIGNINQAFGTCGCCEALKNNTVIVAYCIVWESKNTQKD